MKPYRISSVRLWLVALLMAATCLTARAAETRTIPFVFTDLNGQPVRLADHRGKWVLVNFWAHWCPLCWVEVPALNELARRNDFVVIGVSLDYGTDEGAVRSAITNHNLRFHKHIAGGSRRDPNSPHRQVGPVDFFPTSYLYDPTGEIVMFIPGQVKVSKVLAFTEAWKTRFAGQAPATPAFAVNLQQFEAALAGRASKQAYQAWRDLLGRLADASAENKLAGVNGFINQRIRLTPTSREDYWASLAETLTAGKGGVEEIAIAKYYTLLALNVPAENLRLVYARQRDEKAAGGSRATMVLAYYPAPKQDPVLLDHTHRQPVAARERTDLRPMFSFNSQALWGDVSSLSGRAGSGELPVWQDTLRRARNQGFE